MKVWRVEDENGIGPYRLLPYDEKFYDGSPERPTPIRESVEFNLALDKALKADQDVRFGFETREQLLRWFEPVLNELERIGCVQSLYEVDDSLVHKTPNQLIFHYKEAVLLQRVSFKKVREK